MTLPSPATQQRITFFAAGVLFSLAAVYVGWRWPEICESLFGEGFHYDSQPPWYRVTGSIVAYLPLIGVGVLVLLRVRYRRSVRPVSYSVGVGAFYFALFILLVIAQSQSPF